MHTAHIPPIHITCNIDCVIYMNRLNLIASFYHIFSVVPRAIIKYCTVEGLKTKDKTNVWLVIVMCQLQSPILIGPLVRSRLRNSTSYFFSSKLLSLNSHRNIPCPLALLIPSHPDTAPVQRAENITPGNITSPKIFRDVPLESVIEIRSQTFLPRSKLE